MYAVYKQCSDEGIRKTVSSTNSGKPKSLPQAHKQAEPVVLVASRAFKADTDRGAFVVTKETAHIVAHCVVIIEGIIKLKGALNASLVVVNDNEIRMPLTHVTPEKKLCHRHHPVEGQLIGGTQAPEVRGAGNIILEKCGL